METIKLENSNLKRQIIDLQHLKKEGEILKKKHKRSENKS